jgi:hypothetical protein
LHIPSLLNLLILLKATACKALSVAKALLKVANLAKPSENLSEPLARFSKKLATANPETARVLAKLAGLAGEANT